jgi:phenylacetate-CoA ligase
MRRIGKITGRSDDMLIIRGVNVFPSQIEEILLGHEALCGHYQLQVSREGTLDQLTVLVEVRHEISDQLSRAQRSAIAEVVRHQIKSGVGVTADVQVLETGSIERTLVGKAKRVIDKRPKAD